MSNILVITFEDENQALSVLKSLKNLEHQNLLNLNDAAVIVKDEEGKVEIKNMTESGVKIGAVGGGALGLLIGSITVPRRRYRNRRSRRRLDRKDLRDRCRQEVYQGSQGFLTPGSSAILFIVGP